MAKSDPTFFRFRGNRYNERDDITTAPMTRCGKSLANRLQRDSGISIKFKDSETRFDLRDDRIIRRSRYEFVGRYAGQTFTVKAIARDILTGEADARGSRLRDFDIKSIKTRTRAFIPKFNISGIAGANLETSRPISFMGGYLPGGKRLLDSIDYRASRFIGEARALGRPTKELLMQELC